MENATFTLYDRYDAPRMRVIFTEDNAPGKNVKFGLSLCSDSDKWNSGRGLMVAYSRISTDKFKREFFRTARAHKLIQSLCEEDFHKLMTMYEFSTTPMFACSGDLAVTYQEAVNLMNNGTSY
jgi:hypothetical protein